MEHKIREIDRLYIITLPRQGCTLYNINSMIMDIIRIENYFKLIMIKNN